MTTESDGVKQLLSQLAVDVYNAAGDGSAATQASNEVSVMLARITDKMTTARAHAYQELGNLQDAQNLAQLVFSQTVSAEASEILSQLNMARERVNLFANRLSKRINEMDKFARLLDHWIETEMSASGVNVRVVAEKITELYNRY